jgi:hypothetical protein
MRDDGGPRKCAAAMDSCFHAIGREHVKRCVLTRGRQCMRVQAHKEGVADAVDVPAVVDGLGDRQYMPFIEGPVQRGTSDARWCRS